MNFLRNWVYAAVIGGFTDALRDIHAGTVANDQLTALGEKLAIGHTEADGEAPKKGAKKS